MDETPGSKPQRTAAEQMKIARAARTRDGFRRSTEHYRKMQSASVAATRAKKIAAGRKALAELEAKP